MKRLFSLLLGVALVATFFISCDQQKALDQILTKPEMKTYMMTKMMEDEAIKTDMVNQLLADSAWVNTIIERLSEKPGNRAMMFEKIIAFEGMADIMLEKMAEDPELKKKMKAIGRRR